MPAKNYPSGWRKVRAEVLERDSYRCQIRSKGCEGRANEVDHIVPLWAGGSVLDPINLRAACRPCNVGRNHNDRWRTSDTKVVLVYGPPGAGKSTFVDKYRSANDLVIDMDRIAQSLGSPVTHGHSPAITSAAAKMRSEMVQQVRMGRVSAPVAWIVSANPQALDIFPHHEAHLIDPGIDETKRRSVAAGRPAEWLQLIDEWYAAAHPSASRNW